MGVYNTSSIGEGNTTSDIVSSLTQLTGYWLGNVLLIIIFLVCFGLTKYQGQGNKESLFVSSLLTFIFSVMFYAAGVVGDAARIFALCILIVSILINFMLKD